MKQIKLNAAARLSQPITAKAPEASEWWHHLPSEQKEIYINEHPNSKYADQAIKEGEASDKAGGGDRQVEKPKEISEEHRAEVSGAIRSNSSKIAHVLKKTFPLISGAASALKSIATGKPLTHEHKEVLHDLGGLALKTALSSAIGPHGAMVTSRLGLTAIHHAIEHFKEKKAASADKDDIEVFVDAIADGVDQAKEAPVPKEHAAPKSHYRTAIAKHLKASTKHIVEVIDKSFQHIKPATQGLVALSEGQKLTDEHKKALKGLGKIALGLSIATLPGGLAAHLAAGVGISAVNQAYKAISKKHIDPKHILHSFVEAIGEGLEDSMLEHAAGGEGGHEG